MQKILIIKIDKLGDMLLTTPMLRILRKQKPDAEIHLLATDYNSWVIKDNNDIDRLWTYPKARVGKKRRPLAALKEVFMLLRLRCQRYDVVIVAQGGYARRPIKRSILIGGKCRIAYTNEKHKKYFTHPFAEPSRKGMHEAERMIELLKPLDIDIPDKLPNPTFILPEYFAQEASRFLNQQKLTPGSYVVIGLGARKAKKQFSTQQVLMLVDWFKEKHDLETVFMWTPGKSDNPLYPGDDETAEPVLAANHPYLHPFRGPLDAAIGLIWSAAFSIFPDSGLMHFAAASPGGVLGLFAETDVSPPPETWRPLGKRADYIEAEKQIAELSNEMLVERIEKLLAH